MRWGTVQYWRAVATRAARETVALTPWSSPAKLLFGLGPTLVACLAAYQLTGSLVQTSLIAVCVTLGMAGLAFIWKLLAVPAAMAAEAAAELARARPAAEETARIEHQRRRRVVDNLVRLYLIKEGPAPEIEAGLSLPPMDWLNEHLADHGEDWQIFDVRGCEFSTLEIRAMTAEEKRIATAGRGRAVF